MSRRERALSRRAYLLGYRLQRDGDGWSLLIRDTGELSSIGAGLSLDEIAEVILTVA